MVDLTGQVALITGASRGIGKASALRLAEAGAKLVINYKNSAEQAQALQADILAQYQVEALCIQADISVSDEVKAMFAAIKTHFGRLDILVNNAGMHSDQILFGMKESQWDQVINTNLKGLFLCSKSALKMMLKQKYGRIINISSVLGIIGNPGQSNYATTKAGVLGFTRSLAQEVAQRQIMVNAIAPGYIDSDMTKKIPPEKKEELLKKIPFGRFGTCQEVAEMVLFLSSKHCQYMTGQTLNIDGGLVMA